MKNKKGLTLIELLAIIVILAIIAIIAIPVVLNIIDRVRFASYARSADNILDASRIYFKETQIDNTMSIDGDLYNKIIETMAGRKPDSGEIYIKANGEIALALKYDKYCFKKAYNQNIINSEEIETCSLSSSTSAPSDYNIGDIVYFNPNIGEICTDYKEQNSLTGVKDGCLKWMVYKKENDNAYLILDHNTTVENDWLSIVRFEEDVLDLFIYGEELEPINLYNQLENDTKNWIVSPHIVTAEDIIEQIPYFQNLEDGTDWKTKYTEYFNTASTTISNILEDFDVDSYETEEEMLDEAIKLLNETGLVPLEYMYEDILKGYLSGTQDVMGYWTTTTYSDFDPFATGTIAGSFLSLNFSEQNFATLFAMPTSFINDTGLRPYIILYGDESSKNDNNAPIIAAKQETTIGIQGDTSRVFSYFTLDANGTSRIESVDCISDKDGSVINITDLSLGAHKITCTAIKENGKSTTASGNIVLSEQLNIDDLKETVVTTGDGLYLDKDGVYRYKGTNPNNYIMLDEEQYRILAIEPQGIKVIRSSTLKTGDTFDNGNVDINSCTDEKCPRNNSNNTYCQAEKGTYFGCNAWTSANEILQNGIKSNTLNNGEYSIGTVTANSSMYNELHDSYYYKLHYVDKYIKKDATWNIGPITSWSPTLSNVETGEKSWTWTGKIGLMSVGEYLHAQLPTSSGFISCSEGIAVNNSCGKDNWMVSDEVNWTINPEAGSSHNLWSINNGSLDCEESGVYAFHYRPIVVLNSNIKLVGQGTSDYAIYTIVES